MSTLHPSCIHLLHWSLKRSVLKRTRTGSAFSTNESAWKCNGHGPSVSLGVKSGPRLHGPGLTSNPFTFMSQIKACPGDKKIMQSNPIFSNVYVNLLCAMLLVTYLDVNVLQYYFLTIEQHKAMVQDIHIYCPIGKNKNNKKKSLKAGKENNLMRTHPLSLEFCTSMCEKKVLHKNRMVSSQNI